MRNESYIHPQSTEIESFFKELCIHNISLEKLIVEIFEWFNKNISYSRLSAPYYPLQRSDLDLLKMKSGTCGDYARIKQFLLSKR